MRALDSMLRGIVLAALAASSGCRCQSRDSAPAPATSSAPATRTLAVDGLQIQIPSSFIALEPELVDRLRQSAEREEPEADHVFSGARSLKGAKEGLVYLQRSSIRRPLPIGPRTVKEALEQASAETLEFMKAAGARLRDVQTRTRDGGVETCLSADSVGASGETVTSHLCSLYFVGADEKLRALSVDCVAKMAGSQCPVLVAARVYAVEGALPLDAPLTPVASPGLEGVGATTVGALAFGMTRKAFQAECRKGGYLVDQFDWKNETPQVRGWVKEGKMGQCSGLPDKLGLAGIVQVNVIFHEDRLVSMSLYVRETPDATDARLSVSYPRKTFLMGRMLHVIHEQAQGDEILDLTVGPSRVPGAQSVVTFASRTGTEVPPLLQ